MGAARLDGKASGVAGCNERERTVERNEGNMIPREPAFRFLSMAIRVPAPGRQEGALPPLTGPHFVIFDGTRRRGRLSSDLTRGSRGGILYAAEGGGRSRFGGQKPASGLRNVRAPSRGWTLDAGNWNVVRSTCVPADQSLVTSL